MKKSDLKKSPEELQEYMQFRRRGFKVPPKKGKGSFKRKQKYCGVEQMVSSARS